MLDRIQQEREENKKENDKEKGLKHRWVNIT